MAQYTEKQTSPPVSYPKQNVWSGVLFGIGIMALIDEIIFHQLLQWHHFYDQAASYIGIMSDGLVNAFALFGIVIGLLMFADLRQRHAVVMKRWLGSVFMGAGGFQLFDGIVNHKLLGIHQVRYVENVLLYDIAWNFSAVILIIVGIILFRNAGKTDN